MILVGYGSNDNRLTVWQRMEWVVCHSYHKHFLSEATIVPAIHQYSESEGYGISDSAAILVCASGKQGEIKTVNPNKMHVLIKPFMQPELTEWPR